MYDIFHGHPSIFKVMQDKKLPIFTQIGSFWTVFQFEYTNGFEILHKA